MTIKRQYSLPNCTLILEGLGDASAVNQSELRPLMSILINSECHFADEEKPLTGGRDFFESFVAAVTRYAQEILSGVHTFDTSHTNQQVQLQKISANRHRLCVRPEGATPGTGIAAQLTREVDLTTVQLFDLVEAVDQFFADTQTLPDLALNLAPVSKRYARSSEPVTKRAVPAAVGASSLALLAIALFFVPVPKIGVPTCLKASEPGCTSNPNTGASPTPGASPAAAGSSPSPSPTTAASPSSSPTASPDQPDLGQLEAALTSAPEITDSGELETLGKQLYSQIDKEWQSRSSFPQDLVYRVGVGKDGSIVGYKPVNPAALTYAKQTPLLNLLYIPTTGSRPTSEPLGQFKVVFTSSGVLEVAPWQQSMASPIAGVPEITEPEQIKELQPKLYDQLDQNWKSTPTFEQDLIFRVRVKADGTIADYQPDNQSAVDYAEEIPLPNLSKLAVDDDTGAAQEPLALFKVVFKPDGKLEISPWRGRKE